MIAVTAIDVESKVYGGAVQGAQIDFSARASRYLSRSGSSEGRYVSGTSVAAPFVTARIAVDQQRPVGADGRRCRDIPRRIVDRSSARRGADAVYGYGLPRLNGGCRNR